MNYIVYGLGISGISAVKFLSRNNEVIATDDNEKAIIDAQSKLNLSQVKFLKPDEIEYGSDTVVSFSPGIPLFFPKRHKILKTPADLACDIEIFYRQNSHNDFIAITGTNGKSTTTALTGFVLKELGVDVEVGGNIGVPCFELPVGENKTYVFETSSYQLDLLSQTHFHIAALLNITPDHIERHGSLEGYIAAKKRIFRNQNENDFALIDVDNENSRGVFKELKNDKSFRAKLIPVSTFEPHEGGVALIDGVLYNRINGADSKLELRSEFLRGKHNEQNMVFAFGVVYCELLSGHERVGGVANPAQQSKRVQQPKQPKQPNHLQQPEQINEQLSSEKEIIAAITKFKGLRHRLQLIAEIDGIKFINDSKATNAESTENALKAYDNNFWILGGRPKEGGISSLKPYFKKIIKAYLVGDASEEFAKTLSENSVIFEKCHNLKNAFEKAVFDAKNNSLSQKNILLSPACASLDQWKNFEERGDYFCKLVDELQNSQKG